MKIWFDKTATHQSLPHQAADCPCPTSSRQLDRELAEDMQTGTFEQARSLYVRQYDQERWLVCHPIGAGKIIVLDQAAYGFLQQFQLPRTLLQMVQLAPDWPLKTIETAITVLLSAGILQNVCATTPPYSWIQDDCLTVWMHITNACNLRCSYCYLDKTSDHMADDTAHRSMDAVFRSARKHNIKAVELKYAGGEASLFMPRVMTIHDYAAQLAQDCGISLGATLLTNGVVLSQRAIEDLKARQIRVMISLDGLDAYHDSQRPFLNGHGSSRYVLRTIERLLANALLPHISITVSSRNLEGLPQLMAYVLARNMPFTISYYRQNECSAHLRDLRFAEERMITAMRSVFNVIEQQLPQRSLLGYLLDRTHVSLRSNRTC
ncbi:MAG: radical SAM protein, partial [Chloroflexi bacterium]